uniref:Putative 2-hydroxyacid dehydrogenase UNK4.10 n=1 Tax=Anthurium amnicola TaxID=1678845 RepID=A0A1D1ZHF1_9ARAE
MAIAKQEVLVFGEIRHAKKPFEEMKERYEFKEFNSTKNDFLLEANTKYENVVAILLAHGADQIINKFDTETLDALSPAVNVILAIGNASELVDVKAATENGVFVADTSTHSQLSEEETEAAILENLDFALITGVPKNPVNEIEKVEEAAIDKAGKFVALAGEVIDLDYSDIQIKL